MGRPLHLVTHLMTTGYAGCCAQEINDSKGALHKETAPMVELLTVIFWFKLSVFLAALSESPTYLPIYTYAHIRNT